jgi:hypothetical protein
VDCRAWTLLRRHLLGVLERAAVGEVMIPVARNVWQPIGAAIPAAAARRRINRQGRLCGCVHWMYGNEP